MRTLLVIVAGVLLNACAGSGGGGGQTELALPPARVVHFEACGGVGGFGYLFCWGTQMQILRARCPGLEDACVDRELARMNEEYRHQLAGGTDTLSRFPPQAFESWTPAARPGTVAAPALVQHLNYGAAGEQITSIGNLSGPGNGTATVGYDAAGAPFYFGTQSHFNGQDAFFDAYAGYQPGRPGAHLGYSFHRLEALGEPGLDIAVRASGLSGQANPFVTATGEDFAVVANAYAQGWEHQSFGLWNQHSGGWITASSFGAPTPGAAVPTAGNATFTGKVAGVYVSRSGEGALALADLRVSADFAARTLAFSSTQTRLTRDLGTTTAAPHLNFSGVLAYAQGSATFNGTLHAGSQLAGPSLGRFYGPAAQELGGTFALRSPFGVEAYAGAYGAKR